MVVVLEILLEKIRLVQLVEVLELVVVIVDHGRIERVEEEWWI